MNIALLKEKLEALDDKLPAEGIVERRNTKALVLDLSDETHYDWEIPEKYLDAF